MAPAKYLMVLPRRTWILLVAGIVAACCLAASPSMAQKPSEGAPNTKTVTLTLDYGDGCQKRFVDVPWADGMTVFQLLEKSSKHPRGYSLVYAGKGETLLVTSIDGTKNEGSGRNWIFEVNGKMGEQSCAITKLKGGDSVLWRFGGYE